MTERECHRHKEEITKLRELLNEKEKQHNESKSKCKLCEFLLKANSIQIEQQRNKISSLNRQLTYLWSSNREKTFTKDNKSNGPKKYKQ